MSAAESSSLMDDCDFFSPVSTFLLIGVQSVFRYISLKTQPVMSSERLHFSAVFLKNYYSMHLSLIRFGCGFSNWTQFFKNHIFYLFFNIYIFILELLSESKIKYLSCSDYSHLQHHYIVHDTPYVKRYVAMVISAEDHNRNCHSIKLNR